MNEIHELRSQLFATDELFSEAMAYAARLLNMCDRGFSSIELEMRLLSKGFSIALVEEVLEAIAGDL